MSIANEILILTGKSQTFLELFYESLTSCLPTLQCFFKKNNITSSLQINHEEQLIALQLK